MTLKKLGMLFPLAYTANLAHSPCNHLMVNREFLKSHFPSFKEQATTSSNESHLFTRPAEVEGVSDVFPGVQNTASILKAPKGLSHHSKDSPSARRGLITEEKMR